MGNETVMYLSGKEENKLYKNQNIGFDALVFYGIPGTHLHNWGIPKNCNSFRFSWLRECNLYGVVTEISPGIVNQISPFWN